VHPPTNAASSLRFGHRKLCGLALIPLTFLGLLFSTGVASARPVHVYENHSFGGPGAAAGDIEGPAGVVVNNATHNIYVADSGNNRIDEFKENGEFIKAWGWGVGTGLGGFEECTEVLGCKTGTAGTGAGQLDGPQSIAIDNSGKPVGEDPSVGDVYVTNTTDNVIEKFSATGAYLGQITGTCKTGEYELNGKCETSGAAVTPFQTLYGVAVDTKGELWVSQNGPGFAGGEHEHAEFDNYSDGEPNELEASRISEEAPEHLISGFTVDSEDGLYLHHVAGFFTKLDSAGETLFGIFGKREGEGGAAASGIAVDLSGDNVYLDVTEPILQIEEFTSEDSLVESFGAEQLSGGGAGAVAVDASNQTVYVAQGDTILVYPSVLRPNVLAREPSGLHSEGAATLNGTVDPEGLEVTECKFEYVSDAVFKEPPGGANEVQTLTDPVGTKFKLEFKGTETAVIYGDEEAGEVQEHLEEIPSLAGNVKVEGPEGGGGPWTIEFIKGLADEPVPAFTVTEGTATVAITTEGRAGGGWAQATKANCEQEPSKIPTGSGGQPVSAPVTGLTPDTLYDYRLAAGNTNGLEEESGEPHRFVAPAHPTVSGESSSNVGSSTATLTAEVDPGGAPTSYYVEYGTSEPYSRTAEFSTGAGQVATGVQVQLTGLQPGGEYHYRFVASNVVDSVAGAAALMFATAPGGPPAAAALPDDRVYELVTPTPPGQDAMVYAPGTGVAYLGGQGEYDVKAEHGAPFRVAPGGEAVAYEGDPTPTGGNGAYGDSSDGNQYVVRRSPQGGWERPLDVQPPGLEYPQYTAFSSDLSVGILRSSGTEPLAAGVPSGNETDDLYAHSMAAGAGGGYDPLFTETPFDRSESEFSDGGGTGEEFRLGTPFYAGTNASEGAAPASSHLLFASDTSALAGEGALQTELKQDVEQEVSAHENDDYLYDSAGGRSYLVDLSPQGKVLPDASFGGQEAGKPPDLSHVISADGSRVFWTDLGTGDLYVRENDTAADASTVLVSAGGEFVTASTNGEYVFFIKGGDLYRYDVNTGQAIDLAPAGEVVGVMGSSADGSYVYFVAQNVLAGNENARKETAKVGVNNLYEWHEAAGVATTTFVATGVSPESGAEPYNGDGGGSSDLAALIGEHGADVTPDGHSLLFMSNSSLTGYRNTCLSKEEGGNEPIVPYACSEVFLYEAGSGALRCVSCSRSGAAPSWSKLHVFGNGKEPEMIGGFLPLSGSATYQFPVISDDGSRVFFDSLQPLVPQAKNGYLDVYEWERDGAGSCQESEGCVYLLSSPTVQENSYLLGTDTTGENVFFISTADLVAADRGGDDVIYDARVNGLQPPAEEQCNGTGCQGVPPAPPIFATPASVTFSGTGNYPPPPPKQIIKKTVKCKKGETKNSKGKCVKKKSHKKKAKAKKSAHTNRRAPR
jgi:hypothetical protein